MSYQIYNHPKTLAASTSLLALPGAKLYFYLTTTTTPTDTYTTSARNVAHTNPVVADAAGVFAAIYLDPLIVYKVTYTTAADVLVYTVDPVNDQVLSASSIGELLYPRTAAEISAGVTPTNYAYPEGYGQRYGVAADGSTDDRAAIMRAYSVFKNGGSAPHIRGNCKILKDGANVYSLLFDDDVILDGDSELTLLGDGTNDYTLLYALGGTDVRVDVKGVKFDLGKVSISAGATNEICLRLESSIDTLNVENCDFQNYDADGIYINATVSGTGGRVHHNRFKSGGRSAVTVVKGQYVSIDNNDIGTIARQPITVQATNGTTVCRQISVDYNRIIGGGTDSVASDRCGIFISHVTGAASAYMGQYTCRGNVIKDFGVGYGGGLYAFGIETRELSDIVVSGNEVTGCLSAGLYSYLTIRAAYIGNLSASNGKGLWMNACTDYADIGNLCRGNTLDRDYNGPDGDATFLQADGLNTIIARGSVSFSGGTPSLNSAYNCTMQTDLGTGDTRFAFITGPGDADYSVNATFRGFSGTTGLIQSASHSTSTFRVVTFNAGVGADEAYDFVVIGVPALTTEPT